jgi:hypothetical protein
MSIHTRKKNWPISKKYKQINAYYFSKINRSYFSIIIFFYKKNSLILFTFYKHFEIHTGIVDIDTIEDIDEIKKPLSIEKLSINMQ